MNADDTPAYEWNSLPWTTLDKAVYKLQKRIYHASRRGDVKAVHRLQRLLMSSWSAKCLAVRRVTQENRGKKTAGIDGLTLLSPTARLRLVPLLRLDTPASPLRRIWIPKPGSTEQRPLGIPVIRDCALQALVKLALEPEWEARFEPHSYGFRPGRSGHDALQAIFNYLRFAPKFVLDADIRGCFDNINHAALLTKLSTAPRLRRTIKGWLKAGIMEQGQLAPTRAGTPQGGVISPLLANIALHGLETAIAHRTHQATGTRKPPVVIRYADDFVILHKDRAIIEESAQQTTAWLAGLGLELKPSKTRITHTFTPGEGTVGFDFLGCTVRQYPTAPHRPKKDATGRAKGFTTIITPSKKAQQRQYTTVATIIERNKAARQEDLIGQLNPVIRGWTAYFSTISAQATFDRMDFLLYQKLWAWARHRHPKKSRHWIAQRYWHVADGHGWRFRGDNGITLARYGERAIRYHTKVRDDKSVYDGDWAYWATQLGRSPVLRKEVALLLRRQKGTCRWCGLTFRSEDLLEVDHVIPQALGGPETRENKEVLHRHCHDAKHRAAARDPRFS